MTRQESRRGQETRRETGDEPERHEANPVEGDFYGGRKVLALRDEAPAGAGMLRHPGLKPGWIIREPGNHR
jgi:hypothetical protein